MTEQLRYHLDRHAFLEEQGRCGVAQAVRGRPGTPPLLSAGDFLRALCASHFVPQSLVSTHTPAELLYEDPPEG